MHPEFWRPVTAADVAGLAAACGAEGPCAETAVSRAGGLRHGRPWIVHPDGSVEEGRSVRGLLDGDWALCDPSGAVVACRTWRLGRAVPGTAGWRETRCKAGPSDASWRADPDGRRCTVPRWMTDPEAAESGIPG